MLKRFAFGLAAVALCFVAAASADSLPNRNRIGTPYAAPATTDTFNWTGVYLDVGGGYAWSSTELSADGVSIDGLSGQGWRGDGRVGVDVNVAPNVVGGVFAGYGYGSSEFRIDDGSDAFRIRLTPTWNVGSRIGWSSGKNLWYAGAAWQQAELDIDHVGTKTINGIKALAGVETYIAPQLTFAVEAGHTWYESQSVGDARLEPTDLEVMGRLKWRPLTGFFNN